MLENYESMLAGARTPMKGTPEDSEMKALGLMPDKIRPQTGGNHYKIPIEPVDFIVKNELGYREGNVIKYVTRHKRKNGREDIQKAIDYLNMILEDYEGVQYEP